LKRRVQCRVLSMGFFFFTQILKSQCLSKSSLQNLLCRNF
jgi:hypothetical protein